MVKVSVIIPVYNVENYLKECLDSVVNQTLTDIEIICVNDGSTDNSLAILESYVTEDNRIKIINQSNKGLGASRNAGLNVAKGEYVLFVDSDDYLEIDAVNQLVSIADEKKLDLVIFKLINFYDETKETFKENYHEMNYLKESIGENVFDYKDIMDFVINVDVTAYTKLFKYDLISSIRFNEELIFEDNLFTMEYIFKAKRCFFYSNHLYHRRIRNNSIITSHSKNYVDVIEIFNKIIEKNKELGLYSYFKDKLFIRKIQAINMRYNLVDSKYKSYFFNKIKKDFIEKKEEYYNEIDFHNVDLKSKFIFDSAITSNDFNEFDFQNEFFDYKQKYGNLRNFMEKFESIKMYETARIDIKNNGSIDNTVEVIENSDVNSIENFPEWLSDEKGKGLVIESFNNSLNLVIKIINSGKLNIILRGVDARDKFGEFFPVYIDFLSFTVNGDEQILDNTLVWHNEPFNFTKDVVDSEIIKITLKWLPFNKFSNFFNKTELLDAKCKNLINENNCLTTQNNELKKKIKIKNKKNKKLKKELSSLYNSNSWKLTGILRFIRNFLKNII